ncbi:hypothetical protein [Rubrimonas cliftonensis]|uniref:PAP2 superfamily protein n=1 Tax=Rubrimonas cliftonensis TaxID=89524 RepID=A0A1H4E064_9RHOB|nr:hypothetical protein [Rubrimonas cliftonensis]SEA78169.1 hypothetical protein SAMN05444370_111134 [Rubrimonas cliftonensis]
MTAEARRATETDRRAVALAALCSAGLCSAGLCSAGLCSAGLFAFALLDPPPPAHLHAADPALVWFRRAATGIGNSGWMIAACLVTALVAAHRAAHRAAPGRAAAHGSGLWMGLGLGLRLGPAHEAASGGAHAVAPAPRRALRTPARVAGLGTVAAPLMRAVGRARPEFADSIRDNHPEPLAFDFRLDSPPSCHAVTVFARTAALLIAPRWRPALVAVTDRGATSPAAGGAHRLTDVVAGAALRHRRAHDLARIFTARGLPVAMAAAPSEARAGLHAAFVLAAAALRRARPLPQETLHALHRALVRRRRADA